MRHQEEHLEHTLMKDDEKPSTFLCNLNAITDPGSRGFDIDVNGDGQGLFIVRQDNRVFGYRNSCPHTGAPLDWSPDQFLDMDGALIQCAMHGALFSIETGECLHGPCVGASLETLPIAVIDDQVCLLMTGILTTESTEP